MCVWAHTRVQRVFTRARSGAAASMPRHAAPRGASGEQMGEKREKLVIGRVERVDFPGFGLVNLEARVDTGARTSSLHCRDVTVVSRNADGTATIEFSLLDPEHPDYDGKTMTATDVQSMVVRSSNGEEQERWAVTMSIKVAGRTISTPFTLADRGSMTYPVLLGRRLLRNGFIVDVARKRLGDELFEEE